MCNWEITHHWGIEYNSLLCNWQWILWGLWDKTIMCVWEGHVQSRNSTLWEVGDSTERLVAVFDQSQIQMQVSRRYTVHNLFVTVPRLFSACSGQECTTQELITGTNTVPHEPICFNNQVVLITGSWPTYLGMTKSNELLINTHRQLWAKTQVSPQLKPSWNLFSCIVPLSWYCWNTTKASKSAVSRGLHLMSFSQIIWLMFPSQTKITGSLQRCCSLASDADQC